MSKRESLLRYSHIINKLRNHPATFDEIDQHLEVQSEIDSYNYNVSKRTFQRDLDDIRSLYNIDIRYDHAKKVYFMDQESQPDAHYRILEAFDTVNALSMSGHLSNYIHFEKRKPQGTENLFGLLHAVKSRTRIRFLYQKYWDDKPTTRTVEPYGLKEFKNRWYVLAKDTHDGIIKSFAMDRMSQLEILKTKFDYPKSFRVEDFYKNSFGIINSTDEKPDTIILSFSPVQGKYIKSLPLHASQQIITDNAKELRIKLTLCVTYDFVMELLSYGETVTVIEPKSLITEMKTVYTKALKQYQRGATK